MSNSHALTDFKFGGAGFNNSCDQFVANLLGLFKIWVINLGDICSADAASNKLHKNFAIANHGRGQGFHRNCIGTLASQNPVHKLSQNHLRVSLIETATYLHPRKNGNHDEFLFPHDSTAILLGEYSEAEWDGFVIQA